MDRAAFTGHVQDALDHLYDHAYLQVHPLATLLLPQEVTGAPGHALHRVLRETIDLLRPPPDAPYHSPAWRTYRYLTLRYVEVLTVRQVAEALGISPRQCRRDHHEAISALSTVLWDRFRQHHDGSTREESHGLDEKDFDLENVAELLAVEVGKIGSTPTSAATPLDSTVRGVLGTLAALAASKRVQLSSAVSPDVAPVAMDRAALRQALLGLLLFAIDRGAGGQVVVDAFATPQRVKLSIVVRRPAARHVAEAWDAQREDTRWAVSRHLVEMHGGDLSVAQRSDGTEIALNLPLSEPPVVLVVDDNADVLCLFRRYLSGGYRVVEAANGDEAIRLAREIRPNAVTLDVMMPSQDGWEVLQLLKNDPSTSSVPIIVCSILRERELALSLGAVDFLAKPVTKQELLAALQRCLAGV